MRVRVTYPWSIQADEALHAKLYAQQIQLGISKSQLLRLLLARALGELELNAGDAFRFALAEGIREGRSQGYADVTRALHPPENQP